jgi:TRAP transporter TAXI family solute receptor
MKRLLAACLCIFLTACSGGGPSGHSLIIATATPGGTYYPVGVAIGTLLTDKLTGEISASAINSAGSGENIQMLINGEAQLAILQGLYGAMAYGGTGVYDAPSPQLRSITMLWNNVEHFTIVGDRIRSGTLSDLSGLNGRFSIGKRGSGTEGSTTVIFEALDVAPNEDFTPARLGYSPSAQAMMDGRIAGASLAAGPPVGAVTQVFAQMGASNVAILNITKDQLEGIRRIYPVWTRYVIAAGTYPGQTEDVASASQPNFLGCRSDLPEDVVYLITKTLYENLPYLQNIHKATLDMRLDRAIQGLAVPLHAGALRYYKERGLSIPDDLLADPNP